MSALRAVYNGLFRRTSTFALTVIVGALMFDRGFDNLTDWVYARINKGKMYKDIAPKYAKIAAEQAEEEDE